jgi:hypothetical protein
MYLTKDVKKLKTRISDWITFFFYENRVIYDIRKVEEYTARQATHDHIIRRMRVASWIIKTTDTRTRSEYLILAAFQRQKWLCESALMLLYTYIACLVNFIYLFLKSRLRSK